jgi:hypothetical protein
MAGVMVREAPSALIVLIVLIVLGVGDTTWQPLAQVRARG